MKLKNQVTSLELSKKLKGLGVKQESLFWWVADIENAIEKYQDYLDPETCRCVSSPLLAPEYKETKKVLPQAKLVMNTKGGSIISPEAYSAFTVAELGEMLPPQYCTAKWEDSNGKTFEVWTESDETVSFQKDITEANARAKMLIYLLENNLIK